MNGDQKERFWNEVQGQPERDLTSEERHMLAGLLRPGGLLPRAFCQCWYLSTSTLSKFAGLDLTDPKQVAEGIKLQGRLQGMTQLVEVMLTLIEEKDDA